MGVGSKLEAALRGMVEKPFAWLIRTGLNRNEFSPQVERAMENHVRSSPNRREAPTLYDIYLSEKDYAEFGADTKLAQELSGQLVQMARERKYWLERNPVIRFHEDPHVLTGQMRVAAYILDDEAAPASGVAVMDETVSIAPDEVRKLNEDIAREQTREQADSSHLTPGPSGPQRRTGGFVAAARLANTLPPHTRATNASAPFSYPYWETPLERNYRQ